MRDTIRRFWMNLLERLDGRINQFLNKNSNVVNNDMASDDYSVINFFIMILRKVLNHVFLQCDFDVISDSEQAKPLKELCDDLKKNVYKIGGYMLGGREKSECWIVPYFETIGGNKKLCHSYLDGSRVCITAMRANQITDCYIILDAVKIKDNTFLLCRRHFLSENGDLTISYFIGDENAVQINADIPEWQNLILTDITYANVNQIGIGRYKSPVIDFGNDNVYGRPLNYGCGVIEKEIQEVLNQISKEFKHKETKLFADNSIVRESEENGKSMASYSIDGYVFPVRFKPDSNGKMIDIFSPEIRESSYYTRLTKLLEQYQALMGVNELITHEQSGSNATATEIRSLNIDNMSLEDNIKAAVREGNIQTLKADSMYLGVRDDLWSYDETWTDIYDDEQQRLNNLILLYENGAVEQSDLIKYWFPDLSDDEVTEKIERINQNRQSDIRGGIESMLKL